jgi:predicted RNA-binding protein with PUA-like domain
MSRDCRHRQHRKEGYPDASAFDPKHHHYDADSKTDEPSWYVVDVKYAAQVQAHHHARRTAHACRKEAQGFCFAAPWESLSVMPVTKKDWDFILTLE